MSKPSEFRDWYRNVTARVPASVTFLRNCDLCGRSLADYFTCQFHGYPTPVLCADCWDREHGDCRDA